MEELSFSYISDLIKIGIFLSRSIDDNDVTEFQRKFVDNSETRAPSMKKIEKRKSKIFHFHFDSFKYKE